MSQAALLLSMMRDAAGGAGDAMNNLAHSYSSLGRHRDALEMFQVALVFRRRILTENHPLIGKHLNPKP